MYKINTWYFISLYIYSRLFTAHRTVYSYERRVLRKMGANDSSFHFFSLFGGSAEALKGTLWASKPKKIHKRSILKKGIINLSTIRKVMSLKDGFCFFKLYASKSKNVNILE